MSTSPLSRQGARIPEPLKSRPHRSRSCIRTSVVDVLALLHATTHRPWPLPSGPWVMEQGWYHLLFAHWPMDPQRLRAMVPGELELDTFEQTGWVSLTSFFLRMRPRGMQFVGRLWHFPELNCRTYVRFGGRAGIYFFSLDASSAIAVLGARTVFQAPYFPARMKLRNREGEISFESQRRFSPAAFAARYRPVSEVRFASPGTLEHWLCERYCFFTVVRGTVWRTDIHHPTWPLQDVQLEIARNTIAEAVGLRLDGLPRQAAFASRQEVLVWPPSRART